MRWGWKRTRHRQSDYGSPKMGGEHAVGAQVLQAHLRRWHHKLRSPPVRALRGTPMQVPSTPTFLRGVVAEGVLRLGKADGQLVKAHGCEHGHLRGEKQMGSLSKPMAVNMAT